MKGEEGADGEVARDDLSPAKEEDEEGPHRDDESGEGKEGDAGFDDGDADGEEGFAFLGEAREFVAFAGKAFDDADAREVVLQEGADVGYALACHGVIGAYGAVVEDDDYAVYGHGQQGDEGEFKAEAEEDAAVDDDGCDIDEYAFQGVCDGVLEGFDVGGYARHQFARAAVVVKAQSQVLEVVIDLDAEAEEDVLARSAEEVAVDEAEDGVEDIDAEEEQGVELEAVEVGCDFCVGEVAADVIPFCEVRG